MRHLLFLLCLMSRTPAHAANDLTVPLPPPSIADMARAEVLDWMSFAHLDPDGWAKLAPRMSECLRARFATEPKRAAGLGGRWTFSSAARRVDQLADQFTAILTDDELGKSGRARASLKTLIDVAAAVANTRPTLSREGAAVGVVSLEYAALLAYATDHPWLAGMSAGAGALGATTAVLSSPGPSWAIRTAEALIDRFWRRVGANWPAGAGLEPNDVTELANATLDLGTEALTVACEAWLSAPEA